MKAKKIISLVACMILACSATACGGPPMTQQEESGKYNITVACQQEEGEIEVLEKLAEEYEKTHTDVNVIVKDFGGGGLDDYMTNNGRVKTLADIVWVPDDLFTISIYPTQSTYQLCHDRRNNITWTSTTCRWNKRKNIGSQTCQHY